MRGIDVESDACSGELDGAGPVLRHVDLRAVGLVVASEGIAPAFTTTAVVDTRAKSVFRKERMWLADLVALDVKWCFAY